MGHPAQKSRNFLAVHHYWLLDLGVRRARVVQNLPNRMAMLPFVHDVVSRLELDELTQLLRFYHLDEIVRIFGPLSFRRPSVLDCGNLVCNELDKFAPLDPPVTVDVDFFEQLNRSIHQIESF